MKKLAIVILSLTAVISASAQTKTVTNQDLEKFRQQRVESERELKEKYAALGTSLEEVEQQSRQRRAAMEEYSTQLRLWRIAAENAKAAVAQSNALNRQNDSYDEAEVVYVSGFGYLPYAVYAPYGWRKDRSGLRHLRNLPPNMRTVQEYAIMYPNTGTVILPRVRNFRPNGRFGKFGFRGNGSFGKFSTGRGFGKFGIRLGFGRRGF
jgi:hypothetical protein